MTIRPMGWLPFPVIFILCCSACSTITFSGRSVVNDSGLRIAIDRSPVKSEIRQLPNFDGIEASGKCNLDIVCGKTLSVRVECNENSLKGVKTNVDDSVLKIEPNGKINPEHLKISITVPELNSLLVMGAANTTLTDVATNDLKIVVSGAGNLRASGEVQELVIILSGSSHIYASELKAANASVTISGAGNMDIYATKSLTAKISGAGNVKVYGNPTQLSEAITGVGRVERVR